MHNMPMGKRGALLAISAMVVLLLAGCRPLWGPPDDILQKNRFDQYAEGIYRHMFSVPWNAAVKYFTDHPDEVSMPESELPESMRGKETKATYEVSIDKEKKALTMRIDFPEDVNIFDIYPELEGRGVEPSARKIEFDALVYEDRDTVGNKAIIRHETNDDDTIFADSEWETLPPSEVFCDSIPAVYMQPMDDSIPRSPGKWSDEIAGGVLEHLPMYNGILDLDSF